ncbi:response regulator transcription factor [Clostridium botulinum]|uniref:response regulator transcription factor n=1 Tax=Clostridium botulinum TaxID=1491 RepID=UPI0006A74224|nr:response regulator transcription factor [Clostridium botulinum]KON10459.1 transcriptional regulator [Clostridium botulinum]MBY6905325.1 response regulator transcription factor [Clostridium botulinum]MBY6926778.1 response regulator transcription factor [Clostridium botulinum]MBY6954703.1 response regulator transcription factor [Clostridium botulinum]MCR1176954.1 response regulator transcription factor [Clostridium botulinum]
MTKILLVEDDMALAIGVEYTLKQENYEVKRAKNLKEAREILKEEELDLILLDLMLPDGSGYDFCSEVREESLIPVIFMTACDEEANVVLGLDMGGDDYITKPIRIRELLSRINAVLRRRTKEAESKNKNVKENNLNSNKIISKDITIEPLKAKVFKGEEEILLTAGEYKLLLILVENKGNVLSRNILLEKIWDVDGNFVDGNTLNVYIKRLREKIEKDPKKPEYIETVRGIGYRWSE